MSGYIHISETNGWSPVTCGNICADNPAFHKWLEGKRVFYAPLMDGSDYGLNFYYKFENPEDATEMKLKFDCTLNP